MMFQALDRLPQLLRSLKASLPRQLEREREASLTKALDPARLGTFLASLRLPLALSEADGMLADPFHALKLGTDEVRNAHLLAWFLVWRNHHGLGTCLLDRLIEIVALELDLPQLRSSKQCVVTTEELADGGRENRVDILINDPGFLLIIEVKINAKEQASQLERYFEIARRRAGGRPWAVIYLTPDGRFPTTAGHAREKIIRMSWIDIGRLSRTALRDVDGRSVTAFLVNSFVRHIESRIGGSACKVINKAERPAL